MPNKIPTAKTVSRKMYNNQGVLGASRFGAVALTAVVLDFEFAHIDNNFKGFFLDPFFTLVTVVGNFGCQAVDTRLRRRDRIVDRTAKNHLSSV